MSSASIPAAGVAIKGYVSRSTLGPETHYTLDLNSGWLMIDIKTHETMDYLEAKLGNAPGSPGNHGWSRVMLGDS